MSFAKLMNVVPQLNTAAEQIILDIGVILPFCLGAGITTLGVMLVWRVFKRMAGLRDQMTSKVGNIYREATRKY